MRHAALLLIALLAGCRGAAEAREETNRAAPMDGLVAGFSTEGARHVRTIVGFKDPESVLYDPQQDVYFVSQVEGFGSHRDGLGSIVRIDASDYARNEVLVAGGVNGALLNAPKGMALQGDTLWVCDIDVVRGFNRLTGAPVGTIDFSAQQPVQLNDIALGSDGTLRVSDTGIHMVYEGNVHTGPDRIYSVAGRTVTVVAEGPQLNWPNGVKWDSAGNRWIVVSFNRFHGDVAAMPRGQDSSRTVLRTGKGQLDGVDILPDGGIIFAAWSDSAVHIWKDGRDTRVIRHMLEPADIGLDTRRGRVFVPLTVVGHVQVWDLGPWWPAKGP